MVRLEITHSFTNIYGVLGTVLGTGVTAFHSNWGSHAHSNECLWWGDSQENRIESDCGEGVGRYSENDPEERS